MPGYNSQRPGTARTFPKIFVLFYIIFVLFYVLFVLYRFVYYLCVNVYCTTATGWQPNCSLTNILYHVVLTTLRSSCTSQYFYRALFKDGTAVELWFRCCVTNRKVAGSTPASVIGFFIDITYFRTHYGPGIDSASNRNEYQEY